MLKKIRILTGEETDTVTLPKKLTDALNVKNGDTAYFIETASTLKIVSESSPLLRQMQAAEEAMKEDYEALSKLAK